MLPRPRLQKCKVTPVMCPETGDCTCADAGPIRHRNAQTVSATTPNPRPCIAFERGRTCGALCGGM